MSKCVVCGKVPSWDEVLQQRPDISDRVDAFGERTLSEIEQMLYHGTLCVGCGPAAIEQIYAPECCADCQQEFGPVQQRYRRDGVELCGMCALHRDREAAA